MNPVIINLLIIVFIVFTVMKRMKEISRQGGELQMPPVAPRGDIPGMPVRPLQRPFSIPERPVWLPPTPVETTVATDEETVPVDEERFEAVPPSTPEPLIDRQFVPTVKTTTAGRKARRGDVTLPNLTQFDRTSLVRGIVMSEILGPPVALRR